MRQSNQSNSHDKDFYNWVLTQSNLMKKGLFEKIDIKNVIEEFEDLGTSIRLSLKSHMLNLIMHLLKKEYQQNKITRSWLKSIENAKDAIFLIVQHNPSLKRELPNIINEVYPRAV